MRLKITPIQDQIPGLREAVERETFLRDVSYLFEVPERIGPVQVKPFTLRHLIILTTTGNPLICGGFVTPEAIGAFLWVVSPDYEPENKWRRWWFLRGCGDLPTERTLTAIKEYLDEAFMDAPPAGGNNKDARHWSFCTDIIHLLASSYGWSHSEITSLPLKIIFQHVKLISHSNDPKAPLFNPSDSVRGQWLKAENEKNKRN